MSALLNTPRGIIPPYVEGTVREIRHTPTPTNHPSMYGGYVVFDRLCRQLCRIIPPCTEGTPAVRVPTALIANHPSMYGGDVVHFQEIGLKRESSLRIWRVPIVRRNGHRHYRIIPPYMEGTLSESNVFQ